MNRNNFYFTLVLIYFLVDFSQLHLIIPGMKFLKLGFIAGKIGILFALANFKRFDFKHIIVKYYLLFCSVLLISMFTAYSSKKALMAFLALAEWFLIYFVGFWCCITNFDRLKIVGKAIIITGIGMSYYVITHVGHGPGMLVDENDAGLVLIMLLPFAYFLNNTFNSKIWQIVSYAGFVSILAAIATTMSRGAMVGTLPTLFIIWLRSKRKILSLAILAVVGVIVVLNAPPKLVSEFESISDTEGGTAGSRRYYWELSIEMFKKKPILGVGPYCWGNAIWSGLVPTPKTVENSTPHSVYFQLISEMGIVGTFFWVNMVIFAFITVSRVNKSLKRWVPDESVEDIETKIHLKKFMLNFNVALSTGMVGGLIAGAFLSFVFYSQLYVYIAFAFVLQTIVRNTFETVENDLVDSEQIN